MSTYTDKIDNHSVHSNLEILDEAISTVENMQDKPPVVVEVLARIALVVKNFALAVETCNKNLVALSWLDESSVALSNLNSFLNNYKSNKDANSLSNNSTRQLDVLLQSTAKINCVKSVQNLRGIVAAENEYVRIVDEYNKQLYEKVKLLESDVENLRAQIDDHTVHAQNALTTLQISITAEKQRLDGFATSYQNQMLEDQKSFSAMKDSLKETFSIAQDERKQAFSEEIENIEKMGRSIDQKAALQSEDIKLNSEQLIETYRKKFDEYEEQVVNIVGIVNTNMFSHRYKQVADNAYNRAKHWHKLAVFFMIAVCAFAIYAFVITVNSDTSWVKLVAKILATTTLVAGGAYAASQASKQEKVERYARKIEMELVAIDPFIASLDDERKSVIKEELARRIFGNADAMEFCDSEDANTTINKLTSIEGYLQSLLGLMNNISK